MIFVRVENSDVWDEYVSVSSDAAVLTEIQRRLSQMQSCVVPNRSPECAWAIRLYFVRLKKSVSEKLPQG
jgi:hypothetical protein